MVPRSARLDGWPRRWRGRRPRACRPAPHGGGRHADLGGDLPVAQPVARLDQGGADDLDGVRSTRVAARPQQHLGAPTRPVTRPARPVRLDTSRADARATRAGVTPRDKLTAASPVRAEQRAGVQVGLGSGRIDAQQHQRAPGEPDRDGRGREGRVRVAAWPAPGPRRQRSSTTCRPALTSPTTARAPTVLIQRVARPPFRPQPR